MKLFRNIKDGNLYKVFYVSTWNYLGKWYEAIPYFPGKGGYQKISDLNKFSVVSERDRPTLEELRVEAKKKEKEKEQRRALYESLKKEFE